MDAADGEGGGVGDLGAQVGGGGGEVKGGVALAPGPGGGEGEVWDGEAAAFGGDFVGDVGAGGGAGAALL